MTSGVPESVLSDKLALRALAAVFARAEEGDGTVHWKRVNDVVDAEVWGQLVSSGVLVSTGEAFVIDDPPAVRKALNEAGIEITSEVTQEHESDVTQEHESDVTQEKEVELATDWRPADKLAGISAVGLMAGYQATAIKSTVASTVNLVLGPVAGVVPFPVLVTLLAVTAALISTAVRQRLVDQERVTAHKERLSTLRERLNAAKERGDEAAVERLSDRKEEMMRKQLGLLKHTLRPMAWRMLVTVPIFLWLSWVVVAPHVALGTTTPALPMVGRIVWTARVIGPMQVWMAWYLLNMLVSNLLAKRALKRISGPATPA